MIFADLLKPETFEFFARFVLSGFLIILVVNAFIFGKKPKAGEALLEIILYSLFNQLIWFLIASFGYWFLYRDGQISGWELRITPSKDLQFYLQVLVQPLALGALLGLARKNRWFHPVSRALSLPISDPYPRAYDHVFAEFVGEALIAVHYTEGPSVYGKYGFDSRASRDPAHSELYVERLYTVSRDGEWTPSDPPRSAFVSLAGVRAIEFLRFEDLEEG